MLESLVHSGREIERQTREEVRNRPLHFSYFKVQRTSFISWAGQNAIIRASKPRIKLESIHVLGCHPSDVSMVLFIAHSGPLTQLCLLSFFTGIYSG